MTEVRARNATTPAESNAGVGVGLFATKPYQTGDVILEEDVLIRLAPESPDDDHRLASLVLGQNEDGKKGDEKTEIECLWDEIEAPADIDDKHLGQFKGMVTAAVCFVDKDPPPDTLKKMLSLHHPDINEPSCYEKSIVQLAKSAVKYLEETIQDKEANTDDSNSNTRSRLCKALKEEKEVLEKIMLIWACNSFENGRIYETISRMNHSCNPNAVIQVSCTSSDGDDGKNHNAQLVKAAAAISPGQEISISYLGSLLYAERTTRREFLQQTKQFVCECTRCTAGETGSADRGASNTASSSFSDKAAALPCPVCHPRENGKRNLEEDVQYDDDLNVHYMYPKGQQPNPHAAEGGDGSNSNDSASDNKTGVMYQCEYCSKTFDSKDSEYRKVFETAESVSCKVAAYLSERRQTSHATDYIAGSTSSAASSSSSTFPELKNFVKNNVSLVDGKRQPHDTTEEDADDRELFERDTREQHLQMASSTMGARHWTTNLLLLMELDDLLQCIHTDLLTKQATDPDMDSVAQAVDMLERLCRFVDGLGLQLHKGHLLSNVIIGVARALVSLGDEKSQKYAAEWLDQLSGYYEHFEPVGIQKVVESLRDAWKRHEGKNEPQNKRLKSALE